MPPEITLPRGSDAAPLARALRAGPELRADAGDGPVMFGHFAVFNRWTEIDSWFEGRFMEQLAPGAFRKTFQDHWNAQTPIVKSLFQHGMDFQFGDKPLGPIDVLREDKTGGYDEVRLLDTPLIRGELLPGLEAGLYGASFMFRVMREDLVEEPEPSETNPNGLPERTIREVRLYEFGPVTFPAYADAEQGVRSMTDEVLVLRGVRSGLDPERLDELTRTMRAKGFAPPPADAGRTTFHLGSGRRDAQDVDAGQPPHLDDPEPPAADDKTTAAPAQAPATATPRKERGTMPPTTNPAPDFGSLDELRSVAEIDKAIDERKSRLKELDAEHAGKDLGTDQAEWDKLDGEIDELGRRKASMEKRQNRLLELGDDDRNAEPGDGGASTRYSPPATRTRQSDAEISDVAEIRARARTREEFRQGMHDNALRAVERMHFPQPGIDDARARGTVVKLLARELDDEDEVHFKDSAIARQVLMTNDPTYRRAFRNYITGAAQTTAEQNALAHVKRAVGVGSTGFPVVWQLDPTLVPTSNFAVNPWRALARIQPIAGTNEWRAVTSGGITAAYAAEATEATDNSPTLAQPDIFAERAQAYVPFSIEASQDWPEIQAALGGDLADAKDNLEATKFALGAGHGSTEPKGIITAATNTTTAGGTAAFAIADVYKLFEALPPRFRPRAQFVANLFIIDKIRQFDTSGGSGVWLGPQGLQPAADTGAAGTVAVSVGVPLLGRNVWESTAMSAALTTGQKILLVGDFRYFVIVERIGMNVEVDPMVLGSNRRPTGQRALYAYWRNSSDALSAAAFQVLVTG